MSDEAIEVNDNREKRRYETYVDGVLAQAQYTLEGSEITFTHTIVPRELGGRGIGSQLARAALDDARDRNLTVVPLCPFISSYIERNPEYLPIVEETYRSRLEGASSRS